MEPDEWTVMEGQSGTACPLESLMEQERDCSNIGSLRKVSDGSVQDKFCVRICDQRGRFRGGRRNLKKDGGQKKSPIDGHVNFSRKGVPLGEKKAEKFMSSVFMEIPATPTKSTLLITDPESEFKSYPP